MFKQAKNIDTAFRHVRTFTLIIICSCVLLCAFTLFKSFQMESFGADRRDNIPVEARDHIKTFHQYFYTLDPDDKVISVNITKALYLADGSAKREYDNLKENGYYSNIIAGNISQQIRVDSVVLNMDDYPYHFRCYGTQSIIRATSTVSRSLITEGFLRNVSRSDNNPHGFLIERWATIENRDIKVENR